MNRSQIIKGRIRSYLGEEGKQKITDGQIYDILDDLQRNIAENFLCVEKKFNLNILPGVANYDLTTGGAVVRNTESSGKIGGKTEVLVNSTDTILIFDSPFVGTTLDMAGTTVPAYKFIIESAYVDDPHTQEEVIIVSKSLTQITLRSASDATKVSYSIGMSAAYTDTIIAGAETGFYRINFIETPHTWKLKEINRGSLTWLKRNSLTAPAVAPTHFSVFDNSVEFWYTPDVAEIYMVHYYKVPTTIIGDTIIPETPERYDTTLIYGGIAELAPTVGKFDLATYYGKKYDDDMKEAPIKESMTKSQFTKIKDK